MSPRLLLTAAERAAADRIAKALETRGIRRKVAIAMLGGDPSSDQIKSKQSQITKWARGLVVPTRESARELARGYRAATDVDVEDDYFVASNDALTWEEQMQYVAEATMAARALIYQEEFQQLRAELEEARREEAEHHKTVMEELRKLRAV